jgi:hypothetical protein
MLPNTPFGQWDRKKRTLTVSHTQYRWYYEAAQRQGLDQDFDDALHSLRSIFGPGELRLIIDPKMK